MHANNATIENLEAALNGLVSVGSVELKPSSGKLCQSTVNISISKAPGLQLDSSEDDEIFFEHLPSLQVENISVSSESVYFSKQNHSDMVVVSDFALGNASSGAESFSSNGTYTFDTLRIDQKGYYTLRILDRHDTKLKQTILCTASRGYFILSSIMELLR